MARQQQHRRVTALEDHSRAQNQRVDVFWYPPEPIADDEEIYLAREEQGPLGWLRNYEVRKKQPCPEK